MYSIIFERRALSLSSSSGSMANALRFSDIGVVGTDTLIMLFAIRVR